MKRFFTLLFLGISISSMAQQTDLIREAMSSYDYETALMLIAQEEEPTSQTTFLKAQALRGLNRYSEALETFRQVVSEEPENARAIIEMAECCKQAGRFTESLKNYERVLTLNPENKYAQLQRITMLCIMEQYAKAERACKEVMRNDSSTAVMRLMAQAQEGLTMADSALYYYKLITEKEPNDYMAIAKRANLHISMNEPEEAIAITEKFREKDTTNIFVNRQNAQAYCLKKDYKKAIDRYEYLVNRGDSTRMTCYYLGMSYYAIEDYYGAHDFLEIAYKHAPNDINILYYYGRACAKTSWKKEGVALLNDAIDIATPSDSTMTNLYNGLIDCCMLAGMYPEAIDAYKSLYKYNPQKHTVLYNIGTIYHSYLSDYKNAEKYFELFLKTRPKSNGAAPKMEGGTLVLNETSYYNAAEARLKAVRKELFFKAGSNKEEKKE